MEALERRGKMVAIAAILFIVFWSQCKGVEGHRNTTRMSYVCPPEFIRLGHSCYYFSKKETTWQKAIFECQDRFSNLTVPARWEDRNLRNYLNKPNVENATRWIGGIYDYSARAWKWGGELTSMHYQSFSKMKKLEPEQLQFHCISMMPELLYRWAPRKCHESHRYICKTRLRKVPKDKVPMLRRRYQRMGHINEITAPSVSREIFDPKSNDVTVNPVRNPKSFDLRPVPLQKPHPKRSGNKNRNRTRAHDARPNELRKRSRPTATRKLTKPFPGYQWNRHDPEGSYIFNAELLRSGRTGLTPQQVNAHLARLKRTRDRQIARRNRQRKQGDWLVNEPQQALARTHPRTYMVDNNISALHPKTIVEEFDMMPPPPPVALPRPTRGAG